MNTTSPLKTGLWISLWFALAAACNGDNKDVIDETTDGSDDTDTDSDSATEADTEPDTETEPDSETEPKDTSDTGDTGYSVPPYTTWEGAVSIEYRNGDLLNKADVRERAYFAGDYGAWGLVTGVDCQLYGPFCWQSLPANYGDYVEPSYANWTPGTPFEDVGDPVGLGSHDLIETLDYNSNKTIYLFEGNITDYTPDADVGLSLDPGGNFGVYNGTVDVHTPDIIEVTSPATDSLYFVDFDEPIDFAWKAGGEGDVYLLVDIWGWRRLYSLEDTGAYTFSFEDWKDLYTEQGMPVHFTLVRMNTDTTTVGGYPVSFVARTEQRIIGTWIDYGERLELAAADTCDEAGSLDAVQAGSYWGVFDTFVDDYSLAANTPYSGYQASTGNDGAVPIAVPAGAEVRLSYSLYGAMDTGYKDQSPNGAIYIATDCSDLTTVVAGKDNGWTLGAEDVRWVNSSDAEVTVYAILDNSGTNAGSRFFLDVEFVDGENLTAMDDSCLAPTLDPLQLGLGEQLLSFVPGDVAGELTSTSTCSEATGEDAVRGIIVPPHQLLAVDLESYPTGAEVLFLLDGCDANACTASYPSRYYNGTESEVELQIVLDLYDSPWLPAQPVYGDSSYDVRVALTEAEPAPLVDDCADLGSVDPLQPGVWGANMKGVKGDLNPSSIVDTSGTQTCLDQWGYAQDYPGSDLVGKVVVPAGGFTYIELDGMEGALYEPDDCAAPTACSDFSYVWGRSSLLRDNSQGANEEIRTVVFDTWGGAPASFTLDVAIEETLTAGLFAEDCAGADAADPISGGHYATVDTISATTGVMQPEWSETCNVYSTWGPEAVTRVTLEPGQRLVAKTMAQVAGKMGDALYLTTDCGAVPTCVAGSDDYNRANRIDYLNETGDTQEFYLTHDTDGGGDFYAIIDIE